jgi:hypothetical protein
MTDQAVTSPATAAPASPAATPAEAPSTQTAPEQVAAQPAEQSQPEPNWDAYLRDPEHRKRVLEHDEVKREFDHRLKSTREADIEARVNARLAEQQARQQAEAEIRRLQEMDSFELGELTKQQQAERLQRERLTHELAPQLTQQGYQKAMTGIAKAWQKEGIPDQEAVAIVSKAATPEDAIDALNDRLAEVRAEKKLKERLPKELDARYEEFLASKREKETSVPTLPQGGAGNRVFSRAEADRILHNRAEWKQHGAELEAALKEGRVR